MYQYFGMVKKSSTPHYKIVTSFIDNLKLDCEFKTIGTWSDFELSKVELIRRCPFHGLSCPDKNCSSPIVVVYEGYSEFLPEIIELFSVKILSK